MKKIIIDPGHGGKEKGVFDPGAVAGGLRECDLALDISKRVKIKLEPYEADVQIGPQGSLFDRVKIANELKADFFLSIHINAGGGTGFESYVYPTAPEVTKQLQGSIHKTVMAYLSTKDVIDRGKKQKQLYVLHNTTMPALLLECLFIDHPEDAAKLKDAVFLDGLANNIAWALVVAFELKKKATSDPCADCQKARDLVAENTRLRQVISQAQSALAGAQNKKGV